MTMKTNLQTNGRTDRYEKKTCKTTIVTEVTNLGLQIEVGKKPDLDFRQCLVMFDYTIKKLSKEILI